MNSGIILEPRETQFESITGALRNASSQEYYNNLPRFSINGRNALGVPVPEIRKIAKDIRPDKAIARKLWSSEIHEAMILATMVFPPGDLTMEEAELMVNDINSWDLCDHFTGNLVCNSSIPFKAVAAWYSRKEEFVKRSAFSTIAQLDHRKHTSWENERFFLECITKAAGDGRNFVKKAVSWAIREIGKSCKENHKMAIDAAMDISAIDSKSAKWIASSALKELNSIKVRVRVENLHCQKNEVRTI